MSQTPNFAGLRVAALESRNRDEMERLISRFGGQPFVSPSMREVAIEKNTAAIDFANRVITGGIDLMVFLTGVGFRKLLAAIERHVDRQRFLDALSDIVTVCRGPKPAAAMAEVGLKPTHRVPEPNTWRELLQTIDSHAPVANLNVGVQEYGVTNRSLLAGLEARGARVTQVQVYQWDFPEDVAPLEANARALAAEERDVVLFTSAHQVVNLLRTADRLGLIRELRQAFTRMAVGSIGPTTSEMLREHELPVDFEPEHPKMGPLVMTAAERAAAVLAEKRAAPRGKRIDTHVSSLIRQKGPMTTPGSPPAWQDSPFLRACRREPTPYTPVWLMRQAGRYMEEYRQVRGGTTFLDLCKNPRLCSEVMCTAVEKLKVDAAIIFSDILPILEPMGMELEFAKGEGPVIYNPLRAPADVDRFREVTDDNLDCLDFVFETVRQTRADLPERLPVIGFSGAPFTLASYAIEGGGSRSYSHTKSLMYRDEGAWKTIMERLARSVARYLNAQIAAGAQCVQIFDSWVGCLGPDDYRRYVLPYQKLLLGMLTPGTPVIHFAAGNPALLPLVTEAGGDVIGVDWRIRLDDAWKTIGYDRAVQGNMDPLVLLSDKATIRQRVKEVLAQAEGRPGHIFNLGHGVVQQTPVEHAQYVVECVHELSQR